MRRIWYEFVSLYNTIDIDYTNIFWIFLKYGKTALDLARWKNHTQLVKCLERLTETIHQAIESKDDEAVMRIISENSKDIEKVEVMNSNRLTYSNKC
jgi:hypothetical protein